MSVSNPQKRVTPTTIDCSGMAAVTLSFDASAVLSVDPADLILIMDRSSSMWSPKLQDAQAAANQLIDIVTEASGGTTSIANGSRIGIVSFSVSACEELQLTEDTAALHHTINALTIEGYTNHRAAFEAAERMLPPKGSKRQIVVMFTDGVTTAGGDPNPVADRLKAAGVEIYCVGLLTDPTQLNQWASPPMETHVAITEESAQLTQLFSQIASEIVLAGAIDAVIEEELQPDFQIIRVESPSHGTVQITGPHSLRWEIGTVGMGQKPETISLTFEMMHVGASGGNKEVDHTLKYTDRNETHLVFPNPEINVQCSGKTLYPEPCPEPTEFQLGSCQDAIRVQTSDTKLLSLGRIVQLDATIKNVCPGKGVAVAVILTEEDADGGEHQRGMKTMAIPAQTGTSCQDLILRCIQFVVPEELDVEGMPDSICNARHFKARVIANYTDTDYTCCAADAVTL